MVNLIPRMYGFREIVDKIAAGENPALYYFELTEGIGPDPRIVVATGRTTCRICGKKIKKGVRALQFCYDFNGSGSWTAQDIQVHLDECPEVA